MKRRFRKLLTLTLVAGLALTVTTGIVSAVITIKDGSSLAENDRLPSDTDITSNADGGMEITYFYMDGTESHTENILPSGSSSTASTTIATTQPLPGYEDSLWEVFKVLTEYPASHDAIDILALKRVPIQYTVNYYDGNTLLTSQPVTVESKSTFDSSAMKDGYTLTGWTLNGGQETFSPDAAIDSTFLTTQNPSNPINLYAVWTPIQYTINYYDGNTLLTSQTMTVESDSTFYSGAVKDGYKLVGWTKANAHDEIRPGDRIHPVFLTTTYDPTGTHTINLYAVWEKTATGILPTQRKTNHSPATGDDMPVSMLAFLMTVSIVSAVGAAALSGKKVM